jgi:hypothetical protein
MPQKRRIMPPKENVGAKRDNESPPRDNQVPPKKTYLLQVVQKRGHIMMLFHGDPSSHEMRYMPFLGQ